MISKEDKSFENIRKEFKKNIDNSEYRQERIKKTLHENTNLRKTLSALIILSPARFGEIKNRVFFAKGTLYNKLYQLIELGLLKKISILDLWNKKVSGEEKIVLNAFKEWTSKMGKGQIQYFAGKTNYFALTDMGKDEKIIKWVLELENEFKKE